MGKILQLFQEAHEQENRRLGVQTEIPNSSETETLEFSTTLPRSSEAEKSVLGCILLAPRESISECLDKQVSDVHFFFRSHQIIYKRLIQLWNSGKALDLLSLIESLQADNSLEEVGGTAFINELFSFNPSTANLTYYVDIVLAKALRRQVISSCIECLHRCEDESQAVDLLSAPLQKTLSLFSQQDARITPDTLKEDVMSAIEDIEQIYERRGTISGLSTGYEWMDTFTDGFHPGDLFVAVGNSNRGIMDLMLNVIEHVAIQLKQPVGVFSFKIPRKKFVNRLMFLNANIDGNKVRSGYLSERDFPLLTGAASKLADSLIFIDDTASPTNFQLRSRMQRMHNEHTVSMIFIDRVDLLRSESVEPSQNDTRLRSVLLDLKNLAQELKIPIFVTAHVEANPVWQGSAPAFNLSPVEQAADFIGVLTYSDDDDPNLVLSKPDEGIFLDIDLDIHEATGRIQRHDIEANEHIAKARSSDEVDPSAISSDLQPATAPDPSDNDQRKALLEGYHELTDLQLLGHLNREQHIMLESVKDELNQQDENNVDIQNQVAKLTKRNIDATKMLKTIEGYLESFLKKA